tara:strand:+ start:1377 stop:1730 length:354 start_codon:yes stop_codon:yes gene_type:complete
MSEEKWITVAQMAVKLGKSEGTIYRRIKDGHFQTKKENKRVYILDNEPTTDDNQELIAELRQDKLELRQQVNELIKQQDQSQQIIAMQQQNLSKLTEQNQLLLESQPDKKWWNFWSK